jgi:NAD(P)-dependent dehydrogenase (short-subunit alcohol dehydrogenase family)
VPHRPHYASRYGINNSDARYPSLHDRVVVVTGGAIGVGASLVEHFVEQGAKVAFLDIDTAAGEALGQGYRDREVTPRCSSLATGVILPRCSPALKRRGSTLG